MKARVDVLAASAICSFALMDLAQAQPFPASGKPVSFTVEGGGFYQPSTDLDGTPGGFSVSRGFLSVSGDYRFATRGSVGLSFGGGVTEYDFDADTGLAAGDPWSRIEDYRISVPISFSVGSRAQAFLAPSVRWNAESDANLDDGRTFGAFAGIAWRLGDRLTLGPGLGVFEELSGGTNVFPILIIDWAITERLSFSTGSGLAATQGPGLSLNYAVNDAWSVGIAGRYESVEFRLDDKGIAPGGIGRDEVFPLVATAVWSPNPAVRLSAFAGVEIGGELSLLDENERTIDESDYETAPIFGGTFSVRF